MKIFRIDSINVKEMKRNLLNKSPEKSSMHLKGLENIDCDSREEEINTVSTRQEEKGHPTPTR